MAVSIDERNQEAAAVWPAARGALTASKQREHTIYGRDNVHVVTLTR